MVDISGGVSSPEKGSERVADEQQSECFPFGGGEVTLCGCEDARSKGNWLELTVTKGPMSLTCLQGNVKKDKDSTGYFARMIGNNNDRPLGAFPYYSIGGMGQTPKNFEIWYRVQDFIAEFGDIMVERKLLAP